MSKMLKSIESIPVNLPAFMQYFAIHYHDHPEFNVHVLVWNYLHSIKMVGYGDTIPPKIYQQYSIRNILRNLCYRGEIEHIAKNRYRIISVIQKETSEEREAILQKWQIESKKLDGESCRKQ